MNTQSLHTPLSTADLATCCRLDDLGLVEFEVAEYYASLHLKPVEWWEAQERLAEAEARLLFGETDSRSQFCAGFVEPSASPLDKLLMLAAMLVSVPLVAWWVGAWVVGVVEGRL